MVRTTRPNVPQPPKNGNDHKADVSASLIAQIPCRDDSFFLTDEMAVFQVRSHHLFMLAAPSLTLLDSAFHTFGNPLVFM